MEQEQDKQDAENGLKLFCDVIARITYYFSLLSLFHTKGHTQTMSSIIVEA